jgi:pentatricopeptide repeat protein
VPCGLSVAGLGCAALLPGCLAAWPYLLLPTQRSRAAARVSWPAPLRCSASLLPAGLQPRDYAYCGLIAAHSFHGDWRRALHVRDRMRAARAGLTVHVYNALLAAMDRAQQYERALELYRDMQHDGVQPNTMTNQVRPSARARGTFSSAKSAGLAVQTLLAVRVVGCWACLVASSSWTARAGAGGAGRTGAPAGKRCPLCRTRLPLNPQLLACLLTRLLASAPAAVDGGCVQRRREGGGDAAGRRGGAVSRGGSRWDADHSCRHLLSHPKAGPTWWGSCFWDQERMHATYV